jgi:hypothetical protein
MVERRLGLALLHIDWPRLWNREGNELDQQKEKRAHVLKRILLSVYRDQAKGRSVAARGSPAGMAARAVLLRQVV